MNDAGGIGDEEAVEILAQIFHFIATRDAVNLRNDEAASVSLVSISSQMSG